MHDFRTIIPIKESNFKIQFGKGIFLIGSCFSEHIAEKLHRNKFQVLSNPFGIIFNPLSISEALKMIIDKNEISEDAIFYSNEMYKSFLVHSKMNEKNKENFLNRMNIEIENGNQFFSTCSHLFITFGTAQVYIHKKNKNIVANNHKLPIVEFEKRMLSVDEIIETWKPIIQQIKFLYPDIQICFSVSPVRHLKMGFEDNMLSKAILVQSIHKLIEVTEALSYFPAFEIMMDDLRDYRFYESDMIHPSTTAINYIYEIFQNVFIDYQCKEAIKEFEKIYIATLHKPFNKDSNAHRVFKMEMLRKIKLLQEKFSYLQFEEEIKYFAS